MVDDAQRLAGAGTTTPSRCWAPNRSRTATGWCGCGCPRPERVELMVGGTAQPMATPNHPWIFEAQLPMRPGQRLPGARAARRHRARGQHDPWAFREEWMGELDRPPVCRGQPPPHLGAHGRPSGDRRRRRRGDVLPVGPQRPQRVGAGRLQRLGWAPSPDAIAAGGLLGAVHARASRPARSTNTRCAPRTGTATRRPTPTASATRCVPTTAPIVEPLAGYAWG
jgi:hypothetical protein